MYGEDIRLPSRISIVDLQRQLRSMCSTRTIFCFCRSRKMKLKAIERSDGTPRVSTFETISCTVFLSGVE